MSERHTRTGHLANDLHNGTCYVPSMGWVGSVMPPGRHRREALMRSGRVRFHEGQWYRGIENRPIEPRHARTCDMWHHQGGGPDRDCWACMATT